MKSKWRRKYLRLGSIIKNFEETSKVCYVNCISMESYKVLNLVRTFSIRIKTNSFLTNPRGSPMDRLQQR